TATRDRVAISQLFYYVLREPMPGTRTEPLSIEDLGDPAIGRVGGQGPQPGEGGGVGPAHVAGSPGTWYAQDGTGLRLPADRHVDRRLGPREADIFDQESEQLFAICIRRHLGLPYRGQVPRQRQDPVALHRVHQADRRRGPGGRFALQSL